MKENYQKALKKLTLFFLLNLIPFNGQSYQNQKGPGTGDQSLFRLQDKSRKMPLLVTYHQTKFNDIIKSGFWVTSKIISSNLCKPIHDITNYCTSICPFESEKCGKGKNYKNLNILRTKRAF